MMVHQLTDIFPESLLRGVEWLELNSIISYN